MDTPISLGGYDWRCSMAVANSDKTVGAFNAKVAELIKAARPEDVVSILKDKKSIIAGTNNNNIQNAKK